jgi:pyruvate kinase
MNVEEVLALNEISLTMFGRGDLRVEMNPQAVRNMHDIQTHFFSICKKHHIESICATGFLESMLTEDGKITPEEIYDMETSMKTHANHLMLSGESTYGAQAKNCIETESKYQRDMFEKLQKGEIEYRKIPEVSLKELLHME